MFRKIALGTVLALGSVSGALAWENVGEIETPRTYVQAPAAFDAFAAAHQMKPAKVAPQTNMTFDPARGVSNY